MSSKWENPDYEKTKAKQRIIVGFLIIAFLLLLIIVWPRRQPTATAQKNDALPLPQTATRVQSPASAAFPSAGDDISGTGTPWAETTPVDAMPSGSEAQDEERLKKEELLRQVQDSLAQGFREQAVLQLKELAAIDKAYHLDLGKLYLQMGDIDQAIDSLEQYVKVNPNDFDAHKMLAKAYYQKNDLENCQRHLQAALALQSDPELAEMSKQVNRETRVQDNYDDASFTHFTIIFEGREHREIWRIVKDILDDAYRSIGQEMDYFPSQKITVILYTERDFTDVTHAPGYVGALFDGKIRIPVRGVENMVGELQRLVFHEYVHAVVHSITSTCPRWLHEGLAELYSGGVLAAIGQQIPLQQLDMALVSGNISLMTLAYQQSLTLVVYLIDRYRLYRMLDLLQKMGEGVSFSQAFDDVYGISFDDFAARWGRD